MLGLELHGQSGPDLLVMHLRAGDPCCCLGSRPDPAWWGDICRRELVV